MSAPHLRHDVSILRRGACGMWVSWVIWLVIPICLCCGMPTWARWGVGVGGGRRCVAAAYDNVIQRDRQKERVGGREGQLMSACSCRCRRLRLCVISHEECIKHSDKVKQHLKQAASNGSWWHYSLTGRGGKTKRMGGEMNVNYAEVMNTKRCKGRERDRNEQT